MRQQVLARKLGMTPSFLSDVERSNRPPLKEVASTKLSEILRLSQQEENELQAARECSSLNFHLAGSLTPMQIELANRFHAILPCLSAERLARLRQEIAR